jgi:hypothetical protein
MTTYQKNSESPLLELDTKGVLEISAILDVVSDAFVLSKFTKDNEYPKEGSAKFFEFTDLCHNLECSLRNAGFETSTTKTEA